MSSKSSVKTPRTILDVLRSAREILTPKSQWIKGYFGKTAKGSKGYATGPTAPEARCFCMIGAVQRAAAAGDVPGLAGKTERYLDQTVRVLGLPGESAIGFNDQRKTTHADVLRFLGKAISRRAKATKARAR
jgi:hypothetical protein